MLILVSSFVRYQNSCHCCHSIFDTFHLWGLCY